MLDKKQIFSVLTLLFFFLFIGVYCFGFNVLFVASEALLLGEFIFYGASGPLFSFPEQAQLSLGMATVNTVLLAAQSLLLGLCALALITRRKRALHMARRVFLFCLFCAFFCDILHAQISAPLETSWFAGLTARTFILALPPLIGLMLVTRLPSLFAFYGATPPRFSLERLVPWAYYGMLALCVFEAASRIGHMVLLMRHASLPETVAATMPETLVLGFARYMLLPVGVLAGAACFAQKRAAWGLFGSCAFCLILACASEPFFPVAGSFPIFSGVFAFCYTAAGLFDPARQYAYILFPLCAVYWLWRVKKDSVAGTLRQRF